MSTEASDDSRRYKIAEVSTRSRDGWRAFAALYGVTPTALAEVFGVALGDLAATAPTDEMLPPLLRSCVVDARRVAEERSRRG